MSVIEAPETVKYTLQQLSVVNEPRGNIERVIIPPETPEPAYKIEARAQFQQALQEVTQDPPQLLSLDTLDWDAGDAVKADKVRRLRNLLSHPDIDVKVYEQSRKVKAPYIPVDAKRIAKVVRGEPLDTPSTEEERSPFDVMIDEDINESIHAIRTYLTMRAMQDKYGNDHYGERMKYRKSLSEPDRRMYEEYSQKNQFRKNSFLSVSGSIQVIAACLGKLDTNPDMTAYLNHEAAKLQYLYFGDEKQTPYSQMEPLQKLAVVRVHEYTALQVLETLLSADPQFSYQPGEIAVT